MQLSAARRPRLACSSTGRGAWPPPRACATRPSGRSRRCASSGSPPSISTTRRRRPPRARPAASRCPCAMRRAGSPTRRSGPAGTPGRPAVRVLVVLTQPPLAEGGATGKIGLGLLRGLAANGVDVRAVAAQRHFDGPGRAARQISTWRSSRSRRRLVVAFATRPRTAARAASSPAPSRTACASWRATPTSSTSRSPRRRRATAALRALRAAPPLPRPPRPRPRGAVDAPVPRGGRVQRRAERHAIRGHRNLVASSPLIAEALRREAPSAEVVLAPLTVDPAAYRRAPLDGPPTAGIIGTAAWPPTRPPCASWSGRVAARAAGGPGGGLLVAGRGTDALGLAGDGVRVLGEVPLRRRSSTGCRCCSSRSAAAAA